MATAEFDLVLEQEQQKNPQLIHVPTLLFTVPLLLGQNFVTELIYYYYPDPGLVRVRAAWAIVAITLAFGLLLFFAATYSFHKHQISNDIRRNFLLLPFILFLYTLQVAMQEIVSWQYPDNAKNRVLTLLIATMVTLFLAAMICLICCNWCDPECMRCAWIDDFYYRSDGKRGSKNMYKSVSTTVKN